MSDEFDKKCPICNSNKTSLVFSTPEYHGHQKKLNTKEFTYYHCRKCSAYYLSGVNFKSNYFRKYYDNEYYEINKIRSYLGSIYRKIPDNFKLWLLKKYGSTRKEKLRLLDVGMGNGGFLFNMKNKNIQKYGIDLNPSYNYPDNKVKMYKGDFINKKFQNKFDIITMWHVLEHIPEPVKLVNKSFELLNTDGLLILSTPNTESLGFKLFKNDWFHLDPPRHVILYNFKNLSKLFEEGGFKIINYKNGFLEFPTDFYWSMKRSIFRYIFYPIYPIIKVLSRDTMIVICQK